jgi:hypothetical protein
MAAVGASVSSFVRFRFDMAVGNGDDRRERKWLVEVEKKGGNTPHWAELRRRAADDTRDLKQWTGGEQRRDVGMRKGERNTRVAGAVN